MKSETELVLQGNTKCRVWGTGVGPEQTGNYYYISCRPRDKSYFKQPSFRSWQFWRGTSTICLPAWPEDRDRRPHLQHSRPKTIFEARYLSSPTWSYERRIVDRSIAKYVGSGCSRGVVIRAARQPHGVSGAGYVKTVIQSPNINTTQTNHATRGEYHYFNPYTYIWGSQNQFSTLILICLQDLLKLLFSTSAVEVINHTKIYSHIRIVTVTLQTLNNQRLYESIHKKSLCNHVMSMLSVPI